MSDKTTSDFGLTEDIGLPFPSSLHVTYWASDKVEFEIRATSREYTDWDMIPTVRFVIQGEPEISKLRDLLMRDPSLEREERQP